MTTKENILSDDEIIDTLELQLFSLTAYMKALGYEWAKDTLLFDDPTYFVSFNYKNKHRRHISFANAVKLYNGYYADNRGNWYISKSPFDFDAYSLAKANAVKVITKVNLQINKRTGYVNNQSNLVSFVHPVYYKMFMTSKYFPFT